MKEKVKIQKLECLDDLELLIKGDVIKLEIQYPSLNRQETKPEEYKVVYYDTTTDGKIQFLIPYYVPILSLRYTKDYITFCSIHKESIKKIENGKLILNPTPFINKYINLSEYGHKELFEIIKKSGLR